MRRILEALAFLGLLGVVMLRPLVAESYDSAGSPFTQSLGAVSDPSPLRTLVFDGVILLATLLWLFGRTRGAIRRYRWTGLEWGGGILVVASVVSCLAAGNKRLAVNGSIDWLCYLVLTITLTQLMTRPWHRRLLLAAVLASACAQAAQCFEQSFVGFDETWAHYLTIKEDLWSDQGVDLDSPKVEAFERRLQAREATGFLPLSNVTGAYLVLCGFTAIAVAVEAWKRRRRRGAWLALLPTVAAGVIVCAAMLTKSRGAWVAGAAGVLVWVVLVRFRAWITDHRRRAVLLGWAVAIGGIMAVVGHGLYHDALPGWSLTFRWQYWKASSKMIASHPLAGVGRENFGRRYLQVKPIENPEEVANPHNLFVQAAAEWGLPGLVGVVVLLVGVSLVLVRPCKGRSPPASSSELVSTGESASSHEFVPSWTRLVWPVLLVTALVLIRPSLLGTDNAAFLYYETLTTTLYWSMGFACFYFAFDGSETASSERMIATAIVAGLFAFLLHDMISFALFVPGAATTFFALLAYRLAVAPSDKPLSTRATTGSRWLPVAVATMAGGVVAYVALCPVARSTRALERARRFARSRTAESLTSQPAYRHFQRAADTDPLDPTPHAELARWLVYVSDTASLHEKASRLAAEELARAIALDPFSIRLRRLKMRFYQRLAGVTGNADDHRAAVEAAGEVLSLYPQNPRGLTALADCQVGLGRATRDAAVLHDAIANYRKALAMDDARLSWETLRRFGKKEKIAIETKIEELEAQLQTLAP